MQLNELEVHMTIMLQHLMVEYRKSNLSKLSLQFSIPDFGLVICCIHRSDYTQVSDVISDHFKDWRVSYITTGDDLMEAKRKVIWQLMRGGYMKWFRYKFPHQFKQLVNGAENFGYLIIQERLRIWNNQPKYQFFIEDNEAVLKAGIVRELSTDPSFLDFMPEEEQ